MNVLVDTDVLVDLLRQRPTAMTLAQAHQGDRLAASGYSAMEIIQGTQNAADMRAANRLLQQTQIVWPSARGHDASFDRYRQVHLANAIGLLDVLIAQTALDLNLPLNTFNTKHYAAVPDLQTIQPYTR